LTSRSALTASARAFAITLITSSTAPRRRYRSKKSENDGMARVARMASTAIVTINSIKVKPKRYDLAVVATNAPLALIWTVGSLVGT